MTALWGESSLLALQSGGRGACLCGRQFSRAAGLDTTLRNYVAGDSNLPPQPPDLRSCCLPCGRAAAGCGRTFPAAATTASQPRRASAAAPAARSCEPAGWQMGVQLPSRLSVARSKGSEGAGQHLAARVQSSYQENCVLCLALPIALPPGYLSELYQQVVIPSRSVLAVDTNLDLSLLACIVHNPSGGSQEPSLQLCP